MTSMEIKENIVVVDGTAIDVGARVLDAKANASIILVLIDPDSYLTNPEYRRERREGRVAIRNLRAFSKEGIALWEAEMPEQSDYYFKIVGIDPIEVDAFSSFRCRIDPSSGKIVSKHFMK